VWLRSSGGDGLILAYIQFLKKDTRDFLVVTNARVPVSQLVLVMGLEINLPIALDETLDWQHTERCTSAAQ
jgi:hypothetical protein